MAGVQELGKSDGESIRKKNGTEQRRKKEKRREEHQKRQEGKKGKSEPEDLDSSLFAALISPAPGFRIVSSFFFHSKQHQTASSLILLGTHTNGGVAAASVNVGANTNDLGVDGSGNRVVHLPVELGERVGCKQSKQAQKRNKFRVRNTVKERDIKIKEEEGEAYSRMRWPPASHARRQTPQCCGQCTS